MNSALKKYLEFQKDFWAIMKLRGDFSGHTEGFLLDFDMGLDGSFLDGWYHEFADLLAKHGIDKIKFLDVTHEKGIPFFLQGQRLVYSKRNTGHRVGDLLEAVAEVIE